MVLFFLCYFARKSIFIVTLLIFILVIKGGIIYGYIISFYEELL